MPVLHSELRASPLTVSLSALVCPSGQLLAYEVAHIEDMSCPMELLKIPVPENDPDYRSNVTDINYIPFIRSDYDRKTGMSPNNPRRPVSKADEVRL